ncbi:Hypothetical_protein [Hexamita inflata]|uniref:Hypothetical_protein n=1 Tax=Hexamita inflata TaxID=28002 RepID=A0AA86PCW7_9EUKA|nr:Hypothetical protein HINF_LOCUS24364 [Hexamita inflata]
MKGLNVNGLYRDCQQIDNIDDTLIFIHRKESITTELFLHTLFQIDPIKCTSSFDDTSFKELYIMIFKAEIESTSKIKADKLEAELNQKQQFWNHQNLKTAITTPVDRQNYQSSTIYALYRNFPLKQSYLL